MIVLLMRVTEPFRASSRPLTVAPLFNEIVVRAMMVPTNVVLVSRVAELPICQNTLQACAPLISATVLFGAVISVASVWKMNTESGRPCPFRTRVPVRPNVGLVYTPSGRICPPSSTPVVVAGVRPAASLYAVVKSV
nr:hypothetical protein [Catellatospora tritici]